VHLRSIMKKLKATNRTEVAYITNQLVAGNHSGLPTHLHDLTSKFRHNLLDVSRYDGAQLG
jgi:hypothetical protein